MVSTKDKLNRSRLRNLKLAKLKQLECQLQYQKKQGYDDKTIYQTMKDIRNVKSEIKKI